MWSELSDDIWPESIPFLESSGFWVHVLAWIVVGALTMAVLWGLRALWHVGSPRAFRRRREVKHTAEVLGHGFVQYIGSLDASDVFRDTHLNALRRDWDLRREALAKISDQRLKVMSDILHSKEAEVWTSGERTEFGFRYREPLEVLFSRDRYEWMFKNAGLTFVSDGKRYFPELINLGHASSGLTATFHSEPFLTYYLWKEALPVLASALDAPLLSVTEVSGGTYLLSLNDAAQRDSQMKLLDEYRFQDRLADVTEVSSDSSTTMSDYDLQRKNEMFAAITEGVDIHIDAGVLEGLWFSQPEAVRVVNQVFDYETSSWLVRSLGNYRMLSGEYLWNAIDALLVNDSQPRQGVEQWRPRGDAFQTTDLEEGDAQGSSDTESSWLASTVTDDDDTAILKEDDLDLSEEQLD